MDVNEEVKLLWKFKKKIIVGGGGGGSGQGDCERRFEAFVKMQNKSGWLGSGLGGASGGICEVL